jgi:hypothetical protein
MYALLDVLMYKTSTIVHDARYYWLAYRQLTSLVSTPAAVTQGLLLAYLYITHTANYNIFLTEPCIPRSTSINASSPEPDE